MLGTKRVFIPALLFFLLCLPIDSSSESPESLLGLSLERINSGDYTGALTILEDLEGTLPRSFELQYNLGLAYMGLERYSEAEGAFRKALIIDPSVEETYFQIGRLYFMMGRCDEAGRYLDEFRQRADDRLLRELAFEMQKRCKRGRRPYYLSVEMGGQYDSNVLLEPSNPVIKSDKKSDYRAFLFLQTGVTHPVTEALTFSADYELYQSLHKAIHDLDVRSHNLSLGMEYRISGFVSAGIDYSLIYSSVGEELYSRFHRFGGTVDINWTKALNQSVYYTYTDTRYWDSQIFIGNAGRSGEEQVVGTTVAYSTGSLGGEVGIYRNWIGADKAYWEYDGYGLNGQLSLIRGRITLLLGAEYEVNDYRSDFPGTGLKRKDKRLRYSGELTYAFNRHLSLIVGDSYTFNDSSLDIFEYERNVVSLILKVDIP